MEQVFIIHIEDMGQPSVASFYYLDRRYGATPGASSQAPLGSRKFNSVKGYSSKGQRLLFKEY